MYQKTIKNQPKFYQQSIKNGSKNQSTNYNPHQELDPFESSRLILNHISDGIEIAKRNNLPDRIIDFIRTHHGTTPTRYFYHKAKKENEDVDKSIFCYTGPKPYSKETAILMMADSVEAASKSLHEPTADGIASFVQKIIEEQVCKGKCPIVAYFDIKEGIVIAEGKLDDLCYQSILLHEMIHAFQYYSKKDMENSFKELEAYNLQNMYLKEVSEKKDLLVSLNVKSCRSKQHNTLF